MSEIILVNISMLSFMGLATSYLIKNNSLSAIPRLSKIIKQHNYEEYSFIENKKIKVENIANDKNTCDQKLSLVFPENYYVTELIKENFTKCFNDKTSRQFIQEKTIYGCLFKLYAYVPQVNKKEEEYIVFLFEHDNQKIFMINTEMRNTISYENEIYKETLKSKKELYIEISKRDYEKEAEDEYYRSYDIKRKQKNDQYCVQKYSNKILNSVWISLCDFLRSSMTHHDSKDFPEWQSSFIECNKSFLHQWTNGTIGLKINDTIFPSVPLKNIQKSKENTKKYRCKK